MTQNSKIKSNVTHDPSKGKSYMRTSFHATRHFLWLQKTETRGRDVFTEYRKRPVV